MQLLWEEYCEESSRPYGITQFKEHLNRYIAGTTDKTASTILKDLYIGGVPKILVPDNLKAAVIKRENGMPVANWYDMMKVNSTAADAILDRIVHTAQRFELKGDSLRKK